MQQPGSTPERDLPLPACGCCTHLLHNVADNGLDAINAAGCAEVRQAGSA